MRRVRTGKVKVSQDKLEIPSKLSDFEQMWTRRHEPLRFSGVWRFHELLPFVAAEDTNNVIDLRHLIQE